MPHASQSADLRCWTTEVLPFNGAQGHVAGHEIRSCRHEWMPSPIRSVVFDARDAQADMAVEVHIHWTRWTEWEKRRWPHCGMVVAVVCEDGRRIQAEGLYVGGHSAGSYEAAPIICRDRFAILTLGGGYTLLEVVGVREWVYSKRDAKATAKHIVDPWARDNAAPAARSAA